MKKKQAYKNSSDIGSKCCCFSPQSQPYWPLFRQNLRSECIRLKTTHYYVTFMVDRLTGQIDLTALAPLTPFTSRTSSSSQTPWIASVSTEQIHYSRLCLVGLKQLILHFILKYTLVHKPFFSQKSINFWMTSIHTSNLSQNVNFIH